MKRYIRTGDGRLFDMEMLNDSISRYSLATDFVFADELEVDDLFEELRLNYTSKDEKSGETLHYGVTLNCESTEYVENDDIEKLLDAAVYNRHVITLEELHSMSIDDVIEKGLAKPDDPPFPILGAVWTDDGLNYVAVRKDEQWEIIL